MAAGVGVTELGLHPHADAVAVHRLKELRQRARHRRPPGHAVGVRRDHGERLIDHDVQIELNLLRGGHVPLACASGIPGGHFSAEPEDHPAPVALGAGTHEATCARQSAGRLAAPTGSERSGTNTRWRQRATSRRRTARE
jgi:hypothetical protein